MSKFIGYRDADVPHTLTATELLALIKAKVLELGWQVVRESHNDPLFEGLMMPEARLLPNGEWAEDAAQVHSLYLLPPAGEAVGNGTRRNIACLGIVHVREYALDLLSAAAMQHLTAEHPVYELTPTAPQDAAPETVTVSIGSSTYAADLSGVPQPEDLYPFPLAEVTAPDGMTYGPSPEVTAFTGPDYVWAHGIVRALEQEGSDLPGWKFGIQGRYVTLQAADARPVTATGFDVIQSLPAVPAGHITLNPATVQLDGLPMKSRDTLAPDDWQHLVRFTLHLSALARSLQVCCTAEAPIFDQYGTFMFVDRQVCGYAGFTFRNHQQALADTPHGCTPVDLWVSAGGHQPVTNFNGSLYYGEGNGGGGSSVGTPQPVTEEPFMEISADGDPGDPPVPLDPPILEPAPSPEPYDPTAPQPQWPYFPRRHLVRLLPAHLYAAGSTVSYDDPYFYRPRICDLRGRQGGTAFPAAPGQFVDATVEASWLGQRALYEVELMCAGFPKYLYPPDVYTWS